MQLIKTDNPHEFMIKDRPELRAIHCKSRKHLVAVIGKPSRSHPAPQWVLLKGEEVLRMYDRRQDLEQDLSRFDTCQECGAEWERLQWIQARVKGSREWRERRVCADCYTEMENLKSALRGGARAAKEAVIDFERHTREAEELWAWIKLMREATGVSDVRDFLREQEKKAGPRVSQEFIEMTAYGGMCRPPMDWHPMDRDRFRRRPSTPFFRRMGFG